MGRRIHNELRATGERLRLKDLQGKAPKATINDVEIDENEAVELGKRYFTRRLLPTVVLGGLAYTGVLFALISYNSSHGQEEEPVHHQTNTELGSGPHIPHQNNP